jgi:hypothetical protein
LITRTIFGEQYRSLSSSLCNFLHSPCHLVPLRPKYSPQHPILTTPSAYAPPSMWATEFHTRAIQYDTPWKWRRRAPKHVTNIMWRNTYSSCFKCWFGRDN